MSDRAWLDELVGQATLRPRRLFRTISFLNRDEVPAGAAAVDLVATPAIRVFGHATLAGWFSAYRQENLRLTIKAAEDLDTPDERIKVWLRVIPLLGSDPLALRLTARVSQELELIPESERTAAAKLIQAVRERTGATLPEWTGVATVELPSSLDEVGSILRNAERRVESPSASNYVRTALVQAKRRALQTLPTTSGKLVGIGPIVGIDPDSLEFIDETKRPSHEGPPPAASPPSPTQPTAVAPQAAESSAHGEQAVPHAAGHERIVSSGFSDRDGTPVRPIVEPGETHYFWISIGDTVEGGLDRPEPLPQEVGAGEIIEAVLFTDHRGIEIVGPTRGQFVIGENGRVAVHRRACELHASEPSSDSRLFFEVRVPQESRLYSLRCNLYVRGTLIQSRRIDVPVGLKRPVSVAVDYVLSRSLPPTYLKALKSPRLSILLNQDAGGSHSFRFYGDNGNFQRSSTFGPLELQSHIVLARKGLRLAAWGTDEEWSGQPYRYSTAQTVDTVLPDLIELATRGYVLWDALINKLTGGPDAADTLRSMMRTPGTVHLALREAATAVMPLAMFYDRPIDRSRDPTLCEGFLSGLAEPDLANTECFLGNCRSADRVDRVCPSGFWGFRHAIGLPVSIGSEQDSPPDLPTEITDWTLFLEIAVSTDPSMTQRDSHVAEITQISPASPVITRTRDDTMKALKDHNMAVVYFYCHGGRDRIEGPYLEVGPAGGPFIARNLLRPVRWKLGRPLVFMNGCHTTNVAPEDALELVSAFVAQCGAAGVIGTEVTIFESLATSFAEAFFAEFVRNTRPAGEAIRRARLRVLKQSLNPLGLAYIPFLIPSLSVRYAGETLDGLQS